MCENKTFGEMSDDELKDHFKFSDATVYRYNGKDMSWLNVKKWIESHIHPDAINDQDEYVYKHVFDEGRFPGIFQFTEGGAQSFIKKFKPRNIIDIAMATAIYRPGPLKAKVDQLFLDARSGGEKGIMDHPALEKVFGETFGYCIFQEQIQHVAKEFAGFDPIDAFKLLKAIVKKVTSKAGEQKTETEILQEKFINGAIENGYDKDKAELLYEKLKFFAQYGFNKCVQFDESVIVNDNMQKKIIDVVPGDMIRSRDEKTGQDIQVRVKAVHKNGVKKLVKVMLTTGEVVRCTLDHKFRVVETSEMLPLYEILEKKYSIEVKK
jgi:DNA polymerase-3 subunit alpha